MHIKRAGGYSFPVHLPDSVIGLADAAQDRDDLMNFAGCGYTTAAGVAAAAIRLSATTTDY
jgi:hypothetical protein